MAERITKADIAVQVAILAAYAKAAGMVAEGDRVVVDNMARYYLHIIPAGGTNRSTFPGTHAFGSIGATAREAYERLNTMQETMRVTLDALGVGYRWPADEIAAIRGER